MIGINGGREAPKSGRGRAIGTRSLRHDLSSLLQVRAGARLPPCVGLHICNIIYSMKSINDIGNKRGRGRPATDATPVLVRMPPAVLGALDAWISKQKDHVTRPDAIRRLVEMGLAGSTTGRPKKTAASPKPSELAAKQIDRLIDKTVPVEEQETRKRRLLKGPSEFREVRVDRKKPK